MPTIMTHAFVPIAVGWGLGKSRVATPVIAAGAALAMLPDADVIGMAAGIPYASPWGHRGASHALTIAALAGMLSWIALRPKPPLIGALFLMMAAASHGILDAFTSGGFGPALFWPLDDVRHFAPVRPIRVSPIGADFVSLRGLATLVSEAIWVWLPVSLIALLLRFGLREERQP